MHRRIGSQAWRNMDTRKKNTHTYTDAHNKKSEKQQDGMQRGGGGGFMQLARVSDKSS